MNDVISRGSCPAARDSKATRAELAAELNKARAELAGARELLAAIIETADAGDVNPHVRLGSITGAAQAGTAGPVYPGQNPYDSAARALRQSLAKDHERAGSQAAVS